MKTTDESMRELQSTKICQHDMIRSHDTQVTQLHKPSHYKSQIQFESDTFICNNILLHSAKYYHLDFTILLSFPPHHFVLKRTYIKVGVAAVDLGDRRAVVTSVDVQATELE